MMRAPFRLLLAVWIIISFAPVTAQEPPLPWRSLQPGLALGSVAIPDVPAPAGGDAQLRILRIDPAYFEFQLVNASAETGVARTAKQWAMDKGLSATINASLYQADYLTSVSYMRSATHINNQRLSRDKTLLVFDRRDDSVPPVRIVDRQCEDFDSAKEHYRALVQSIRMISCDGRNVWKPKPARHSTAAIAMDGQGRILFIHARARTDTHALIEFLRKLPLDITRAMYVEGGVQAQLFVRGQDRTYEFVGDHGAGLDSRIAWPIPNVIGIRPRGGG